MEKENKIKLKCHAELTYASHIISVLQSGEIPYKSRDDRSNLDNSNGGFTLIELLVVVLIIGILAAVAVPQYQKAVQKARFTQLVTASKAIVDAQQIYFLANGQYAERADELNIEYPLNDAGTSFHVPGKWQCIFVYSNDQGSGSRISCTATHPDVVLQRWYATNYVNCCAMPSDDYKGDLLCQDFTKTKTIAHGGGSSYHCYTATL